MNIDGGRLSFDARIDTRNFERATKDMEDQILGVSTRAEQEAARIDKAFSKLSATLAGYFTFQAAQNFVSDLVSIRSEFQQLEISFTTMLQSKQKADALMAELVEFAGTTPFGLKDAANAAKQLLAYGSIAEDVTDELRMLGDVAAGTSQPIGELTYLYGTLRTQGRAYLMDIRQFAGRGIPIYQELAKVMGTTVDQVNDFVSSGKVGFSEVQQAFQNMTAAGSMFGGLMEQQSQAFAGQIERIKDAWDVMLNDIAKDNDGIISSVISGTGTLIENYERVLDVLGATIVLYGSYKAALIVTAAIEKTTASLSYTKQAAELSKLLTAEQLAVISKRNLSKSSLEYVQVLQAEVMASAASVKAKMDEMRAEVSATYAKRAQAKEILLLAQQRTAAMRAELAQLVATTQAERLAAAQKQLNVALEEQVATRRNTISLMSQRQAAIDAVIAAKANGESAKKIAVLEAEVVALNKKMVAAKAEATSAMANVQVKQAEVAAVNAGVTSRKIEALSKKVDTAVTTENTAATIHNGLIKESVAKKSALATAARNVESAATTTNTTVTNINAASKQRLTIVEGLSIASTRLLTIAKAKLNAVMLASPTIAYTAAIAAMGAVVYSLVQITSAAALAQEKLNEAAEAGGKSADDEKRKLDQLIEVLKSHTATTEQKKAAYDKIIAQTGGIVSSFSQEEIATGKATGKLQEYIDKVREAAAVRKAFDEFNALAEKMDELNRKGIKGVGTWDKLGRSIANTFAPTSQGVSTGEWFGALFSGGSMSKLIVDQEKKVLQASMDDLKALYGEKWEELVTGIKPEKVSAPIVTVTERIRELNKEISTTEADLKKALDPDAILDKSKVEKLKDALKTLKDERDLLMGKSKEGDRANAELDQWAKKREDILKKLAENEADLFAKGMVQNDQEIQEARNKYASLRKIVEDYNKEAKKKNQKQFDAGIFQLIDSQEQRETGDIQYRQETERLSKQLSERLNIWQKYQDARREVGDQAARQMFANEKNFIEDYRKFIDGQIAALQGKQNSNVGITGVELERLKALEKDRDAYDKTESERRKAAYAEAYQAAMTFEQRKAQVSEKYAKMAAELSDPDNPELKRQRDEAIRAVENDAMQKTEIYRRLNEEILGYTKQQLADQIALLNKALENDLVSPESKERIRAKIKELTETLGETPEDGGFWDKLLGQGFSAHEAALKRRLTLIEKVAEGEGLTADEIARQAEEAEKLKEELRQIAVQKFNALSSALQELSGAFSEIASSIPDANAGLKDTLQTVSDLAQIGGNAAGAVASFMAGDIVGGIAKGIRAIAGVFNIFKQARESAKQAQKDVEAFYASVKSGEMEHARLLRERAREQENINDLTREELEIRQQMLDGQSAANKRDYDYWLRKIQQDGQQVTGQRTEKYGGFLGIGRKTRVVDVTAGMRNATYDDIERLFIEGKLTKETAEWWEELKKVAGETDVINDMLREIEKIEIGKMTGGLTSQGLADTIINGIKQGKRGIDDFAGDLEDAIANALLSAMSYTLLEEPMKKLVKQFQEDAIDGLDGQEIKNFKDGVNVLTKVGLDAAKEIESILGRPFGQSRAGGLRGAIMTNCSEQSVINMKVTTIKLN